MTGLLLAYYGDDFTGSADVMEVLQWAGLRTVLFLQPPSPQQFAAFPGLRAFGVAGWSRSMSPAEMDTELKPVLSRLRDSGAAIVHYKTCSTCDSSPEIGSIGRVLEHGRELFGNAVIPIMVAAPNLGRYQVFGNLFARSGLDSEPYRLDRHPTMRHHPITPMTESDVRSHLAQQTHLKVALHDILQVQDGTPCDLAKHAASDFAAVLFDVLYPEHLANIGAAMQAMADVKAPIFAVGSSGVEYALTAHWADSGQMTARQTHPAGRPRFSATDQLVVVTGSCSPVNDRQITWAEQNGFETIPLNPARLVSSQTSDDETIATVQIAVERLRQGANIILHSSRGPDDPRISETRDAMRSLNLSDTEIKLHSGRMLGPMLGRILRGILTAHPLRRVGVAGGDTSGYIARELQLTALEAIAPVAPGSPLCRAHADNDLHDVEFFFKGGQVGKDDVWSTMLHGTHSARG